MAQQGAPKRSLSPSHDEDGNGEQQGRQRSRAACAPCRTRKRKCDGALPCSTCVRYEYQCHYTGSKRSSHVQISSDSAPEPPTPLPLGHTPPSIIQLQKHPLTAPGARFHHRSIMDPVKTRFVRANSAVAFPRILGMDMESEIIPRLHSFAWHCGIRAEPPESALDVTSLLSWADVERLGGLYFKLVRPEIGLLEEAEFFEQAATRFADPGLIDDFDAVLLGVMALGSFFAGNPHPREGTFFMEAGNILTSKGLAQAPTMNNVSGWILRTIYLRLTSRPHSCWLASSIVMHQLEAASLHKEVQTIAVVYPAAPTHDHKASKLRRRLFWIGRALNIYLSFEYGRTRVNFDVVTTKRFAAETGTHAHHFVELADLLPNDFVDKEHEPDPPAALGTALTKIEELHTDSMLLTLLKADMAFAIYRRLWLMSLTDAKDRADSVIGLGRRALDACYKLLESRTPWWNVVHCPFQFLCVVIAVGTPRSLSYIQDILAVLHRAAQAFDTHMTREAYNQGLALVRMSKRRKEKELEALNAVPEVTPLGDHPSVESSGGMTEAPAFDWANMDLPFEWDIFLNPDLVMSSAQQPQMDGGFGQLPYQS